MSNMSYCRFENTADDLEDCVDALREEVSEVEHVYRKRLMYLCCRAFDELGVSIDQRKVAQLAERLPVEDFETNTH